MNGTDRDQPENEFAKDDLAEFRQVLRDWVGAHPREFWYQVARKLFVAFVRKAAEGEPPDIRLVLPWADLIEERVDSALRASPHRSSDGRLGVVVWLEKREDGEADLHHGPLEHFDGKPD